MHKKNLTRQLKLLLNYVLGPLLFLILVYVMYIKIKTQPDLPQKITLLKNVFSKQKFFELDVRSSSSAMSLYINFLLKE